MDGHLFADEELIEILEIAAALENMEEEYHLPPTPPPTPPSSPEIPDFAVEDMEEGGPPSPPPPSPPQPMSGDEGSDDEDANDIIPERVNELIHSLIEFEDMIYARWLRQPRSREEMEDYNRDMEHAENFHPVLVETPRRVQRRLLHLLQNNNIVQDNYPGFDWGNMISVLENTIN